MSTAETPSDATARNEPAANVSSARPRRGPWEWIWRGRALAEASLAQDAVLDQNLVRQALEHVDLADRVIARIFVPRHGSGMGSALLLYRDALLLTAAATREADSSGGGPTDDPVRVRRLLERMALDQDSNAHAEMLLETDPVKVGRLTEEQRASRARSARTLVHGALQLVNGRQERRARVLAQRAMRMALFVALLLGLAGGTAAFVSRVARSPNLLEHSTRHTSSSYPGFSIETGICDGNKTHILFHTNQEDNPFVEYDMGRVQQLHHVQIVNRQDCCDERALPLVVETSVDGKRYEEVLRRTTPFKKLNEKIRPVSARFVRIRALKKTWLHLERVAAW